jgi:Kinesin motor domain
MMLYAPLLLFITLAQTAWMTQYACTVAYTTEKQAAVVTCTTAEHVSYVLRYILHTSMLAPRETQPAIREHKKEGIYLENVDERVVASAKDVLALAKEGAKRRAVGDTNMNSQSSRSHAVLTLRLVLVFACACKIVQVHAPCDCIT